MTWILVLLDIAAVHRLTRLVTKDVLTQRARNRVIRRAYLRAGHDPEILDERLQPMVEADMVEDPENAPRLAVLVCCRWCASTWVGAAVAGATWAVPGVWQWVALALAASSLSTLLAGVEAPG